MNISADRVARLLQESPQMITGILSCLNHKDLQRLTRVCSSWKSYAARIKLCRSRVLCFMSWKNQSKRDRRWEAMGDIPDVVNFLENLDMECAQLIVFGKLPLSRPCIGGHDLLSIRSRLPPNCTVLGAVTSQGIIGTQASGECLEMQNPRGDCLSSFVLPAKLPDDAKIRQFDLTLEKYNQTIKPDPTVLQNNETLSNLFDIGVDEDVKCLVLISPDYYPFDIAEEIANAFLNRQKGTLALCGGVAETVIMVPEMKNETIETGLSGLLITGSNVRAASLTLDSDINSKSRIRVRLSELKATVQSWGPVKQEMAFIFTCCARGKHYYAGRKNVETDVFREFFPATRLCGMFSLGEYGWDQMNTGEQLKGSCLLQFNTVIAYIGIL